MKTRFSKRVVLVLLLLLVLFPPLANLLVPKANAGTFSPRKLTISDSRAGEAATYDYAFTTTATTSIKQVDIKFCTQAGAWGDTCTAPTGLTTTGSSRASDNLAGTTRTDSQPAANSFRIVVTTPATQSTQAVTISLASITNPTTTNTSFYSRIITYSDTGTTEIDSGTVAFATLTTTSVAVSATVLENFTFSLSAVNSGGTVNSSTTTVTTTAATIPFGTLTAATPAIAAHDVVIVTNASSGYAVTVKAAADPPLTASSNNIDAFSGSYGTPTTWAEPAGTSASVNTGYFGYTTEDSDIASNAFGSNKWAGTETTARSIVSRSTGTTSETTRIGWQVEVIALQPAGSYTGTVVLVATPTY